MELLVFSIDDQIFGEDNSRQDEFFMAKNSGALPLSSLEKQTVSKVGNFGNGESISLHRRLSCNHFISD